VPEGDTIFRSARALGRALTGKTVTRFESSYALLTQANDQTPFAGQTVTQVESRGKWLLIHFSGGPNGRESILATHMLMSGSWHIYRPGEPWQDRAANARIILETADYHAIGFRIPVARIHTAQTLVRDRKIPRTEYDVLSAGFDTPAAIKRLLARPTDEIGIVLLRQDVLAGVGNVFKSEICFVLRLSPFRKVATLSRQEAAEIVATAKRLLAANVLEDSGDRIVTYRGGHRRTTQSADPEASLWVYRRNGEPCRRCGTLIERCLQGPDARSTYWCPQCQQLDAS
jgi:endonuclease VIII